MNLREDLRFLTDILLLKIPQHGQESEGEKDREKERAQQNHCMASRGFRFVFDTRSSEAQCAQVSAKAPSKHNASELRTKHSDHSLQV